VDLSAIARTQAPDTAEDRGTPATPGAAHAPRYEEIAEAAYLRFLRRGASDGRDFDDWIEAERELRRRQS
jgi:hypothetical protein